MDRPDPLYSVLAATLSPSDLQELSSTLNVPYWDLSGSTHSLKALNLQEYMSNRGRVNELLSALHRQRPLLDLKPYLFLVVAEVFYSEAAITNLYQKLGLSIRDFMEREKFAWGSEPWREQKALALQIYMESPEGDVNELLTALKEENPIVVLDFYGEPPEREIITESHSENKAEAAAVEIEVTFANFDIDIGEERDGSYPVKVIGSPFGESTQASWQAFPSVETEGAITFLRELIGRPEDAEELGHTLRDFLFPEPVWNLFTRSQAMARRLRVRLRISQDAADLSRVPWEYCWGTKQFLALNRETSFVRYIPTDEPPESLALPERVRILTVMASPGDQDPIDLEAEEAWLTKALEPLIAAGKVELKVAKRVGRSDLFEHFSDFNPHILHFFGHGEIQDDGEGALIFEKDGRSQPVDARRLMVLLRNSDVKLVVLSACETAAIAEEEGKNITRPEDSRAFMGVAPRLVWAGIPAVIAMQFKVPVTTSTMFMQDFYEQLAVGKPLDTAVTEARIGAYFKADDEVYWAIPVLFMRSPDGVIWR